MKPFYLENRYQDSGWEAIHGEEFDDYSKANKRAHTLSQDAIINGMVRVVDKSTGKSLIEYSAGGDFYSTEKDHNQPTNTCDPIYLPTKSKRSKASEFAEVAKKANEKQNHVLAELAMQLYNHAMPAIRQAAERGEFCVEYSVGLAESDVVNRFLMLLREDNFEAKVSRNGDLTIDWSGHKIVNTR